MPHVFRLPTYQDYIQSDIHFLPWVHPPPPPSKSYQLPPGWHDITYFARKSQSFPPLLAAWIGTCLGIWIQFTEVPIPTYLDVERSVLQTHLCASGKLVQSQQYDLVQNTGAPFWKYDVLDPSPGRLQSHTFVAFLCLLDGWYAMEKYTKKMFRVRKNWSDVDLNNSYKFEFPSENLFKSISISKYSISGKRC